MGCLNRFSPCGCVNCVNCDDKPKYRYMLTLRGTPEGLPDAFCADATCHDWEDFSITVTFYEFEALGSVCVWRKEVDATWPGYDDAVCFEDSYLELRIEPLTSGGMDRLRIEIRLAPNGGGQHASWRIDTADTDKNCNTTRTGIALLSTSNTCDFTGTTMDLEAA